MFKQCCCLYICNSNNYMMFFTKSELMDYYSVTDFSKLSPTDQPKQKYMSGTTTINCAICDAKLETTCENEILESAYCDDCDIKYKREREPVIDDHDYLYKHKRTDEREEYVCSNCMERHAFTQPKTELFRYQKAPELTRSTIRCCCGGSIQIYNKDIPTTISCERCQREYIFEY